MRIITKHCAQYRRYCCRMGELVVSRDRSRLPAIKPSVVYQVAMRIPRKIAADGLRLWRRIRKQEQFQS